MTEPPARSRLAVEVALALKQVQHQKSLAIDSELSRHGSSMAQWAALRSIEQNPGLNSRDLARLAFQTDQSFGALLAKLADAGLITRTPGPRKSLRHQLTSAGEKLLAETMTTVERSLESQFTGLDDEQLATLLELLTIIAARIELPSQ